MLDKIKLIFSSGPKTALAILGLIVIWMILGVFKSGEEKNAGNTRLNDDAPQEVLVRQVQSDSVNREITILGETQYSRRIVITALTEGEVKWISPLEGKLVSEGQKIIQLDNREAKAQLQYAKSLLEQKTLEFEAYEKLYKDELISEAKFAQARSELEEAKARNIQKQIQFDSTAVKAPFEGILQKIHVEQGDYVKVGKELAEVLDFSPFIVQGEVSEKEAAFIKQGMDADAELVNNNIFHGKITYLSSLANDESRSFVLELSIDNTENTPVLSGISSSIIIPVNHNKAHHVPSSTLEINQAGEFGVKLIDADNLVHFQEIKVLQSDDNGVWVSGLPDIAKVIIRGQGFVKPGDIVSPVYEQKDSVATPETSQEKDLKG